MTAPVWTKIKHTPVYSLRLMRTFEIINSSRPGVQVFLFSWPAGRVSIRHLNPMDRQKQVCPYIRVSMRGQPWFLRTGSAERSQLEIPHFIRQPIWGDRATY